MLFDGAGLNVRTDPMRVGTRDLSAEAPTVPCRPVRRRPGDSALVRRLDLRVEARRCGSVLEEVAKTLIDVDEEYLAAAQEALHTETKKDTVNMALREVAALAARRRDLQRLTSGGLQAGAAGGAGGVVAVLGDQGPAGLGGDVAEQGGFLGADRERLVLVVGGAAPQTPRRP